MAVGGAFDWLPPAKCRAMPLGIAITHRDRIQPSEFDATCRNSVWPKSLRMRYCTQPFRRYPKKASHQLRQPLGKHCFPLDGDADPYNPVLTHKEN